MEKTDLKKIIVSELDRVIELIGRSMLLNEKARILIPLQKYHAIALISNEREKNFRELRESQSKIMAIRQQASVEPEFMPLLTRFDAIMESMKNQKPVLPFPRSYWVVPETLLAGEIPSATSPVERTKKISGLLDSGVTAIINLTEEKELNHNDMPLVDYSDEINELVAERLIDVEIHRMSIKDLNIPTKELMKEILKKIDEMISRDRTVYAHCWGGVGRTGTVVGCFLIDKGIAQPEEAIGMIELLKINTDIKNRDSPETNEQRDFILNWKKDLSKMP